MPDLTPPATILLVDDRPDELAGLEAVLAPLGGAAVRAASGEEALDRLAAGDFAVVLLAVRLPGLSGFETARRLRAAERDKRTPVIFLATAESPEFPVAEAYQLGAVDYLVKPLVPEIVRAKVAVFADLYRKSGRLRALERRERERAEEARRETEARFERFMQHLPGLAWIKDAAGRYLYANAAAERAFGRPRADLYGRTDDEVFPPATAAAFKENDRQAVATPAGLQTVEVLTHPDGTERHSLVSKFPIPGPDGRPALVGGVAIDVTDQKRAEAAHRESEERAAFVRRASGVGFWYCDLPFDVLEWDDRVKEHFHLPPAAVVTIDTFYARIHPADREPTRAAIAHSVTTGAEYDTHYRTVDPATGAEKWVRAIGRTAFGPDGAPRRFDGVTLDVTEQRRAEAELRLVTDNAPVYLCHCDADGRLLFVNRPYAARFGLTPAQVLGRRIPEVVGETAYAAFSNYVEDAIAGQPVEFETEIPYPGGSRVVHCSYVPDPRPPGARGGFVAVIQDVTARKAVEAALADAARRKDEFMAMLAHELRNPLAPIRNALHILHLSGGAPAVVGQVREMMERQITHLGRLVDDLLDVSRLATGKVQLRRERLDLAAVARQAVLDHEPAFRKKGVAVGAASPPGPAWVSGDPTRLAQVLDNLLTNALKFTPAGGEVAVAVAAGPPTLTVRDTGAGIDADMLPRLFEPFSQADRTLDRSPGGLGLGLAIVKGLAELHGGSVSAESHGLGGGATFTVTFPPAAEPPALAPGPGATPGPSTGRRVLVVEDNRDAADSLRMLLEVYGYEVAVAYTGPDGVRTATAYCPQVVVCDIGLPGLDGYGVAAALRRDPATAAMTLIALTGYGQDDDRRRAKEAGFDAHLTKPADPAALAALIGMGGAA
jgi:PAS domain S-box-containing protein